MLADEFEGGVWADTLYRVAVVAAEKDTEVDELDVRRRREGGEGMMIG